MRRKTLPLVENGVIKRVVYARATAERVKRSNTKTALPNRRYWPRIALPNEMGEMPQNIVFAPPYNPQTVEQMIASTDAVLVTRLW